jgi:hypothetical protein
MLLASTEDLDTSQPEIQRDQVARFDTEVRVKTSAPLRDAVPAKMVFALLGGLAATLIWATLSIEGNAYHRSRTASRSPSSDRGQRWPTLRLGCSKETPPM